MPPSVKETSAGFIVRAQDVHPIALAAHVVGDAKDLFADSNVQEMSAARNARGGTVPNPVKAIDARTNALGINVRRAALARNVAMDAKVRNALLTALVRTATVNVKGKTVMAPKSHRISLPLNRTATATVQRTSKSKDSHMWKAPISATKPKRNVMQKVLLWAASKISHIVVVALSIVKAFSTTTVMELLGEIAKAQQPDWRNPSLMTALVRALD